MESLAIIPARGGSKGVPRKNVALLCGKPLIAWTIEAARNAALVTRVVVSTDDPEIGAVAQQHHAEVVWRPAEISGDLASSESALLQTLASLQREERYRPEIVTFLQCTSPLTAPVDIDGTIMALCESRADTALAVTDFHYFLWRPKDDDLVGINHAKQERLLRQQRAMDYLEAGGVYVMRAEGFSEHRHRFFGRTAHYHMPRERCWEIDSPLDLQVAEVLLREQRQAQQRSMLPEPLGAIVLDFDGVFTDNRVLVFEDGREGVLCSRGDGIAIAQLKACGIPILVLSSETNRVVRARCEKLGLECRHGVAGKWPLLREWLAQRAIPASQVVYVGNDTNDLECLQSVGCGIVVQDAHPQARAAAQIVLDAPGGDGAIREIAGLLETGQTARGGIRYGKSA